MAIQAIRYRIALFVMLDGLTSLPFVIRRPSARLRSVAEGEKDFATEVDLAACQYHSLNSLPKESPSLQGGEELGGPVR